MISKEASRQEEAKEEQAETRTKARQEASLRKLADALAQRPEGDTLSALADLVEMSRKRVKEGLDTLLERGKAVGCKVTKGRGNREMAGFRLVG